MSMVENSEGTPAQNPQWCPKCGASLQGRDENKAQASSEAQAGAAICDACGTPLPQPHASDGSSDLNAPPVHTGKRNPLALVVVALVAAGMLYFGMHMARRSGPTRPIGLGYASPAPDFTLQSLDGHNMRLSDFRGKAVLLNFWATWCGPCKIEMPWFVELQNQYGPEGLQIVGVAMDDSGKDEIAKFAQEMGVNYPVLLGKEAVGDEYGGVPALPESFFISRDGKIVDKIIGLRGRAEIEDAIKKALNTPPGTSPSTAATASAGVDLK